MKFSILLPTHNRADVLPFAIRSALAQTEEDWELLIVGDGCTDETVSVVSDFHDQRLRWLDLPKTPGFGYANRNFAFRQMRGELVALLPHDDLWFPDHLALLGDLLASTAADWACSRTIWVEPGGVLLPGEFDLRDESIRDEFIAQHLNGVPSCCVVHRRDCFARFGYWNDTLLSCADLEMWSRILSNGGRLAYLPTPTSLHFRAHWRAESNVVSRYLAQPDLLNDLPKLPPGMSDQQSAWKTLVSDLAAVAAFRQTVARIERARDAAHLPLRFFPLVRLRQLILWVLRPFQMICFV